MHGRGKRKDLVSMERLPDQLPPADAACALDPGSGPWPGRDECPGSGAATALTVLLLHLRIFAGGRIEDPLQNVSSGREP